MKAEIFNKTRCQLGEGPLWHPERQQLFWFDILGKRLLTMEQGKERQWEFDEHVSAAGWVDRNTLLIASASALARFDLLTGEMTPLVGLEADNGLTRSNDGRTDPWGGFWIGTMGLEAQAGAGAIYRYYGGALTRLVSDVTISNAICFSPDRRFAYYTDTKVGQIMRQPLDGEGWPKGQPQVSVDLQGESFGPDGAVIDAEGCMWNAQWGASRVACYAPDGTLRHSVSIPAVQVSCPAFGGSDLTRLFVTTAAIGCQGSAAGLTYAVETGSVGQAEHRVRL